MAGEDFYSFEDYMHHVTLRKVAWCGDEYADEPNGQRLLLVSESYYDRDGSLRGENPSKKLVELIISGEWKHAYYTKVRRLMQGATSAGEDRAAVRSF